MKQQQQKGSPCNNYFGCFLIFHRIISNTHSMYTVNRGREREEKKIQIIIL
jgi:hypothetical protein